MRVYAEKFTFDGQLSDLFGVVMVAFSTGSLETTSAGSKCEIITEKFTHNNQWNYYGKKYSEPIKFKIQLIKYNGEAFTQIETRRIISWLSCTDGFKPFQLLDEYYQNIIFYAMADSINELSVGNSTIGFEVSFICDSPFGYSPPVIKKHNCNNITNTFSISIQSDEIGYIYPKILIEVLEDVTITILNLAENRTFEITDCKKGEFITVDGKRHIISTTKTNHDIQNCFNWKWFRLFIKYPDTKNEIIVNGKCNLTLEYQFIRKVGLE